MKTLFLVLFVLILVVLVFYFLKKNVSGTPVRWPYYAKKLLSAPEQVLYGRLVDALPDHVVMVQVGLSRVLGIEKGVNHQEWFNRINRMSLDFVVCRKDFSVIAVVELDDSSHDKPDRVRADQKKDKTLMDAGVKIVRWNVKSMPDVQTIAEAFLSDRIATSAKAAIRA